ncbi:MAG: hypothetical protein HY903_06150 [Deltaproteobacteria bacterium]|nr:hypothetical protein [Deltaproteobacteria bacterium]
MQCPSCELSVPDAARVCPRCGTVFARQPPRKAGAASAIIVAAAVVLAALLVVVWLYFV